MQSTDRVGVRNKVSLQHHLNGRGDIGGWMEPSGSRCWWWRWRGARRYETEPLGSALPEYLEEQMVTGCTEEILLMDLHILSEVRGGGGEEAEVG